MVNEARLTPSAKRLLVARYEDRRTRAEEQQLAADLVFSEEQLYDLGSRWQEPLALGEIAFDGPYRLELAGGQLVYLAYDGQLEASCPRQQPDIPLPAEDEWRRWWRHHPLSVEVSGLVRLGVSIERASLLAGVTTDAGASAIAASKHPAQVARGQVALELLRRCPLSVGLTRGQDAHAPASTGHVAFRNAVDLRL